jgi:hypothetical protein
MELFSTEPHAMLLGMLIKLPLMHRRAEVVLVGWTEKRQSLDRAAGC